MMHNALRFLHCGFANMEASTIFGRAECNKFLQSILNSQ